MTTTEIAKKYQELVEAIVKMVPGVRTADKWICSRCSGYTNPEHAHPRTLCIFDQLIPGGSRPITLEDVLRALPAAETYAISNRGWFFTLHAGTIYALSVNWNLGHSLEWHRDNDPETISSLHSLLV